MIDEIKKSINNILYERATSPFYGTLLVSWLIWNWKITYITFFVSESKLATTKIDFIVDKLSDKEHILIYPLFSTIALLTLIPFITNGAYWLSLRFNRWRVNQKNEIEKKQLLTVEQSIQLREEVLNQETRFENILSEKNQEINQLKAIIDNSGQKFTLNTPDAVEKNFSIPESNELNQLAYKITQNEKFKSDYKKLLETIKKKNPLYGSSLDSTFFDFMEGNDLIADKGNRYYQLTARGKRVNKIIINEEVK